MGLQPVLGWFHHRNFVKHQSRTIVSHIHIWYGRALMILGIINGGLGLMLACASQTYIIVYSVLSGVSFIIYTGTVVFGEVRRRRLSGVYVQKD